MRRCASCARRGTTSVSTSAVTVAIKQSKSKYTITAAFTSVPANHAKTEWRPDTRAPTNDPLLWVINHTPSWRVCIRSHRFLEFRVRLTHSTGSILRRLGLGEFFFRVGYVGLVRAAEFKQPLLTPQIRFGKFKLGALAFCYCFLLGFDQLRERCFRHFQLLFVASPDATRDSCSATASSGLGDSSACQFSFALDHLQRSLLDLDFREHADLPQAFRAGGISFRTLHFLSAPGNVAVGRFPPRRVRRKDFASISAAQCRTRRARQTLLG